MNAAVLGSRFGVDGLGLGFGMWSKIWIVQSPSTLQVFV